MFTVALKNIYV